MPRAKRLVLPALLAGAALAFPLYRRGLGRLVENLRLYSAPDAGLYDAVTAPLLGGFFARVSGNVAGFASRARVLEVGSGPGRLAVQLAGLAPGVRVTGVDVSPEMVERATQLAADSGMVGRVGFRVGDVASLPFDDASFDVVVSTFSLHHWPDAARGLAEIHRVLRPGGVVRIYDLAGWIRRLEHRGPTVAELAGGSPFGEGGLRGQGVALRLGPIPLAYRADFERARPDASSER